MAESRNFDDQFFNHFLINPELYHGNKNWR
jgi:hypothetical protein